jgi:hypothetical protein
MGPSARVFTFAAGLSERASDAAQASMPKDVYNAPYKRKKAILPGLSLLDEHGDEGAIASSTSLPPAAHLTLVYEPLRSLDLARAVHDKGLVDYLSTAWERWAALPEDQRCKFFQHGTSDPDPNADSHCGGSIPALVPSNGCARHGRELYTGSCTREESS